MLVVVTDKQGTEVYRQLFDDSKTLNQTVAFLMQQPSGTDRKTVLTNNGHDLSFNNQVFDVETLVRRANGIIVRDSRSKEPVSKD